METNYISFAEFEQYRLATDKRLEKLETNHTETSKTVNSINTNTQLILQKLQVLVESTDKNTETLHQRINKTKSEVEDVSRIINEHINVEPRKDYENLMKNIRWLIISAVITGMLASIAIFR